jgi:parallel beta helix pectate lyase-like protein
MKRPLAALTLALLLALVVTTVVGGVAFGAIVGSRFEAEKMTESSGSISVVPDPDGTGPAGRNLRWASGAGVSARASQTNPLINVPANSPVDQIQVFTRQASGGNAVFAIYVDGTAAANKVGTFSPPAGGLSAWGTSTVTLSPAIQPGPHTLYIGPNATFSNNAFIDWFELHSTGSTPPPDAGGGSCTGTTVNPTSNLENIVDNPGTYCLRGGIYEEADEQVVINADNITIRNVPGERAELRGRIRTNDGATNVRFIGTDVSPNVEGIVLNATYSPISWSISGGMGHFSSDPHLIRGNGTVFDNVELDGDNDVLGDPWYTSQPSTPARAIGTCVLIADGTDGAPAADVQIINSDIHNCGASPDQRAENVGTHALYLSGGLRVQVEHNQIYENGTRGVQIRNGTDNTHVYGNVIDENYVGIGFDDPNTNDNIAENNVVTRNANKNIRNLSDAGTGNVARNNCGYGEPIPDGTIGNVSYSNNVNVSSNPYSVDPEPNADAVVSNTTCNAKLPAGSRFLP